MINLNYKEFVEEANQNYQKLMQETSEIYKRYYVNIPYDLHAIAAKNSSDRGAAQKSIPAEVKFDLVVNGEFLSDNELIKIYKMEENFKEGLHKVSEDKYVAFIFANAKDFIEIDIPNQKNANMNILFIGSNKPLNTVIRIKIGENSKLNLFEYYGSYSNEVSAIGVIHEIEAKSDSEMELNQLHNENSKTITLSYLKNSSGKHSNLKVNSVYVGSSYTRVRNKVEANDENSKVDVNEIIFGSSDQKFDISTYVINTGIETNASLESKAALMDSSFCIMKGFAKINKGAQKSKSYVHERGILLDKNARVNGLPDMSVDENDVKATHSSATAPIDEESVFYLMSKGIDEAGVRKLLVTGFFVNSLSKIKSNLMKELSISLINSKLENKTFGNPPKIDMKNMWVSTEQKESDIFKGHYKYRALK